MTYRIAFDAAMVADLRARLDRTRLADAVTDDWSYGTRRSTLAALLEYWRDSYDFAAAAARLNTVPHIRADIGGFALHTLHLRSEAPDAVPLLLMNGWPSSFVEYGRLTPLLCHPHRSGGKGPYAFHVVIPALPGFGFSDRPSRPNEADPVALFHGLMLQLGYAHYIASGTDIGAGIATRLALRYPEAVRGIHISAVAHLPSATLPPRSEAEHGYMTQVERWMAEEGGYQHLQSTRPQTAAFALNDSPAGLAGWIIEKFHAWSDHTGNVFEIFPPDMLIDTLMIYWATETIGSSMRAYYEARHFRPPLQAADRISVPTAICMWPKDLVTAPREWAERFYNVLQYTLQARGGHFPAWEAPEAYCEDLRRFASALSNS